jgi:uncharacterized membrane protein
VSDPSPAERTGPDVPTKALPAVALHPPWSFHGTDFGRIFSLSDGIFAFSMTLLVLSLALPFGTSGDGVTAYLQTPKFRNALFAYVITFFVIAAWWRTHHMEFGYFRSYDRRLLQFNGLFLIFIAVLPFAAEVLNASDQSSVGVIFFAVIQVATGLALGGTWAYATGMGHLTPDLPKAWANYITWSTFSVPIVFAISIPVALVLPAEAEYLWAAVFVVPLALRHHGSS